MAKYGIVLDMRNKFILLLICGLGFFLHTNPTIAYQAHIVFGNEEETVIENLEKHQLFYGELGGSSDSFTLESKETFDFSVNVLEPAVAGAQNDFTLEITKDGQPWKFIKSEEGQWKNFYDSFSGDNYWMGPAYTEMNSAGKYRIIVSSPTNTGKYVLVTGNKDSFSSVDVWQSIWIIPKIKRFFFNESIMLAYLNQVNMLLSIIMGSAVSLLLIIISLYRKKGYSCVKKKQ
jgi:hypothetical protein